MYRKHFALTAFPFDTTPQPDALFPSAALGEAEARLKHLLELRAIGLVTGEAGSGKTTVCRKVAAALHPGLYRVFYVPLSTGNARQIRSNPRLPNGGGEGWSWRSCRDNRTHGGPCGRA